MDEVKDMGNIIKTEFLKLKRYSVIKAGIIMTVLSPLLSLFYSTANSGQTWTFDYFMQQVMISNCTLFFPIIIALIAGYIITREYTDDTMKNISTIPIPYKQLLSGKLLVLLLLTIIFKVFCGCCDHAMSLRNGAWFYCRHSEVAETLPCHGVRIKMADLEQVVFETIRAQMCPALGIDSNKDKLDLQTVQQAEHEEKLRSIQDSKRHLYEQYALGEIDLETYRTRKAVYDTELVQAKNVHAVITAQTKQIKSDYEIKLKQQEIVQEVGNANILTKALIDRLINKVYVFPGDRIEIEYATQDFLETKESEKEV